MTLPFSSIHSLNTFSPTEVKDRCPGHVNSSSKSPITNIVGSKTLVHGRAELQRFHRSFSLIQDCEALKLKVRLLINPGIRYWRCKLIIFTTDQSISGLVHNMSLFSKVLVNQLDNELLLQLH